MKYSLADCTLREKANKERIVAIQRPFYTRLLSIAADIDFFIIIIIVRVLPLCELRVGKPFLSFAPNASKQKLGRGKQIAQHPSVSSTAICSGRRRFLNHFKRRKKNVQPRLYVYDVDASRHRSQR